MNKAEAEKIPIGGCVVRHRRYETEILRVTDKSDTFWHAQYIILNTDGHVRDYGECGFNYAYCDGWKKACLEDQFLRMWKLLKMQEIAIRPIVQSILETRKK